MSVQLTRHRFTWDDYHAMAAAGALKKDDRVELIDAVPRTSVGKFDKKELRARFS